MEDYSIHECRIAEDKDLPVLHKAIHHSCNNTVDQVVVIPENMRDQIVMSYCKTSNGLFSSLFCLGTVLIFLDSKFLNYSISQGEDNYHLSKLATAYCLIL